MSEVANVAPSLLGLNLSGRARLPIVRSAEMAECGLASLAMVAGYHGYATDLATLRRKNATSLQGMTLRSIMDFAVELGFTTRPIKVSLDMVGQIQLPAILHWDMNHFLVLKKVTGNKYHVHDPALGVRVYDQKEFSRYFTGVALELTPAQGFKKRVEKTTLRLNDLWGKMVSLKRNLLQVFVLSIVLQLFVLASPYYLQLVIDEVLTSFDTDLLLVLALGFGGFSLISVLAQTLRGYVLLYLGSMLSFQMVGNLFRHILRLPISYFEKRHIGDIISRFGSLTPIKDMLTEGLVASLIDGVMALTTLTMMFIYSPKLALIALAAWGFYFAFRMIAYRSFHARQEDLLIAMATEQTTFMESVRGITSLKLFGGEENRQRLWQKKYADAINAGARLQKLNIWFDSANAGIFGLELVILIYVASNLVLAGDGFTVGMIFAFMAYKNNFTEKASALVERAIEFRMLGLHLNRIADIAHAKEENSSDSQLDSVNPAPLKGKIACNNIRYRYSADTPDVVKDANIEIEAGESVAIVGESGCGKTTLLKLMTGLFVPTSGQILIDDIPLEKYGLTAFRRQLGVVMQDDDLFAGSFSENIAFFDPETDMEQVFASAKAAMIHEVIMSMSMGYESLVGDMGSILSGGEKQRLMLARALYRRPKVLFMDEGTAHLDVRTEQMVNDSIAEMGITRIIIAHRPETIRSADRVMEMKSGKLREINYCV